MWVCLALSLDNLPPLFSSSLHPVWFIIHKSNQVQGLGMSENVSAIHDNSRTNWTAPMDEHFIELLLDQVLRGNKTCNGLSREAWTEMITLFNDRFDSKHETNVLKNRFKWLMKQYNNIKILIHNGFSWDEQQHMVKGDEVLWEDYIKAHPEMQSYKTKVLPHYKELCKICGHSVADGRYSLSCFDVGNENEAKGFDDQSLAKDDRLKLEWSQDMDEYFVKLMLEQVHQGNKTSQGFKNKAWRRMIAQFNERFGVQYGKVVLKNRFNMLRRHYSTIKFLLGQRGFTWDKKQQMLLADDPVWTKVIKVRRNFRKYKNVSMPCYIDLCVICGNEAALVEKRNSPQNLSSAPEILEEAAGGVAEKNMCGKQKKRKNESSITFRAPPKAPRVGESIADAVREMTVAVKTLAKQKKDEEDSMSVKSVIDALQAIPGIEDDFFLDACEFLEDEKKASVFLALNEPLRMKWLMRKLGPVKSSAE